MELQTNRKKIGYAFAAFMALMLLCTLISRAVYASGLPQVTTEKPEQKRLTHKVEAEGTVKAEREYALNVLSGLRCRTVYVHAGDRVTPETLLFEVDTEDLKEQIEEQTQEIQKLQLTIQTQEYNEGLDDEKKQTEKDRAWEDYSRMKQQEGEDILSAERALEDAKEAYETAKEAYEEHLSNAVGAEPEDTEGAEHEQWQMEQTEWEEKKNALENEMDNAKSAVEAAEQALDAANENRSEGLLAAERSLEDAAFPSQSDSSLELNRMELSGLQKKLEDYEQLLKSEGKIYAKAEGIVTKIIVSPGERTPDGASVIYAGLDSPLEFCFSLTKEQKKHVNAKDAARLTLEGSPVEVTVDYIQQNEADSELYDVTVLLPEGVGTVGQSGSFTCEQQSEPYSLVIPLEALHEDENKRKYVWLLGERSGILGTELTAEKIYVEVLEQNAQEAALEAGSIDSDTELIVSSTKVLEDRAVVRYKE